MHRKFPTLLAGEFGVICGIFYFSTTVPVMVRAKSGSMLPTTSTVRSKLPIGSSSRNTTRRMASLWGGMVSEERTAVTHSHDGNSASSTKGSSP